MVDLNSFLLALFASLISFGLGVISVYLRDFFKSRAEKKNLNKKFLEFFNSLTLLENPSKSKIKALTLLYSMDKGIISQKLEVIVDFKYSPQFETSREQVFLYISECIEYVTIRIEDENWLLLIGFFPFILFDNRKKDSTKQIDLKNLKESEKDIFIDFLKHLEVKYKKAKIVKKSKQLVDNALIKKIKG